MEFVDNVRRVIEELQAEIVKQDYKVIDLIPSKSGYHLITNPFNLAKFKKLYPVDVQKDAPTNLYIP